MKEATKHSVVRWIHLILGIPVVGYIYSPFDQIPNYAFPTPIIVLSGLWMWKGHLVRRIFSKGAAEEAAGNL